MVGDTNTLRDVIVFLVVTVSVGGLSIIFLNRLREIENNFFAALTDGWKRAVAVALAIGVVTVLWLFGLYMGYFDVPQGDVRAWVEAWFSVTFPAAILQQVIQGFTKPDQG